MSKKLNAVSQSRFLKARLGLHNLMLSAIAFALAFQLSPAAQAQPTVVGYINLTLATNLTLIAVQLECGDNSVQTMFSENLPDGTILHKFVDGQFTTNTLSGGSWSDPGQTLGPGEGAFFVNPTKHPVTATLVGELLFGQSTNLIPAGLSLKSCMVPIEGKITTRLKLQLSAFDNLYLWRSNRFEIFTFLPGGRWLPSEPQVGIAESFFVNASRQTNWVFSTSP